jgi:hypothetical protein
VVIKVPPVVGAVTSAAELVAMPVVAYGGQVLALFQVQQGGGDLNRQAQACLPFLCRLRRRCGTAGDVQGGDDAAGVGQGAQAETKTHPRTTSGPVTGRAQRPKTTLPTGEA